MKLLQNELVSKIKELVDRANYVEVLGICDKLLLEEPDNRDALVNKIGALIQLERNDIASKLADYAISKYPNDVGFYTIKINSIKTSTKTIEQQKIMEQYLKNRPDCLVGLEALSRCTTEKEGENSFINLVKKILEISKTYPEVKYPERVGTYSKFAMEEGNYFYDEILEYRVWVHFPNAPDEMVPCKTLYDAFRYYYAYIQKTAVYNLYVELPLALVVQKPIYDTERRDLLPNELNGDVVEVRLEDLRDRDINTKKYPERYNKEYNNKTNWANRGNIYLQLEDYDNAIINFDKALALDKEYPFACLGKACAFVKKNQLRDAINTLDAILPSLYNYSADLTSLLLFHSANIWVMIPENPPQLELYQESIKLDPKNYRIFAMLAEINRRLGNNEVYNKLRKNAEVLYINYKPKDSCMFKMSDNKKNEILPKNQTKGKIDPSSSVVAGSNMNKDDSTKRRTADILIDNIKNGMELYKKGDILAAISDFENFYSILGSTQLDLRNIPYEFHLQASKYLVASYIKRNKNDDKQKAIKKLQGISLIFTIYGKLVDYLQNESMIEKLNDNKNTDDIATLIFEPSPKVDLNFESLELTDKIKEEQRKKISEFGEKVANLALQSCLHYDFSSAIGCVENFFADLDKSRSIIVALYPKLMANLNQYLGTGYAFRNNPGDREQALKLLEAAFGLLVIAKEPTEECLYLIEKLKKSIESDKGKK